MCPSIAIALCGLTTSVTATNLDSWDLPDHLLPNALTVPGVQHIVDNLCKDVHEHLRGWEGFKADLVNFKNFLVLGEIRERLRWTCMRNTQYEQFEYMFEHWVHRLYEARWHNVIEFVQGLLRVYGVLSECWSPERFERGVDGRFAPQGADQLPFDIRRLSVCLHSAFFYRYMQLVLLLHEIPEGLGRSLEGCVCHARARALHNHYKHRRRPDKLGRAWMPPARCPMSGLRAPEMANGLLERQFSKLRAAWRTQDRTANGDKHASLPARFAVDPIGESNVSVAM